MEVERRSTFTGLNADNLSSLSLTIFVWYGMVPCMNVKPFLHKPPETRASIKLTFVVVQLKCLTMGGKFNIPTN